MIGRPLTPEVDADMFKKMWCEARSALVQSSVNFDLAPRMSRALLTICMHRHHHGGWPLILGVLIVE
jgi:hypothetical protein